MQKLKLLLVDDDEDDSLLFVDLLDRMGSYQFDVTWAASFQVAEKHIESTSFDLFVFDFFLGKNTGLTLSQWVIDQKILTPIILLTGLGDKDIDKKASEIGVYDYLVKEELTITNLERSIRYTLKQAQIRNELTKSELKYRTVIEHSQDIIFIADTDFKLLSVSNSVEKFTGYKQDELLDGSVLDLIKNEVDRSKIKSGVAKNGSIMNLFVSVHTKDEVEKLGLISCNLHKDEIGKSFIHGTIIDKTDEQKAEKARILNEKMEATARLMRTLAHEVRNPLSSISMATESIEFSIKDEENKVFLDMIKRNAVRINEIISKVLNSAKNQEFDLKVSNVQDVIAFAISTIIDRAKLNGIQVTTEITKENFVFPLNFEQLSIALTNLLVNAIEAMSESPEGHLRISFNDGILEIQDNGTGIPADMQGHLFEPYFTTKKAGVGLGLASTLSILKAHHITIDVQSEMKMGTIFTLVFVPPF
ncbi:PAS domain S-box-containing protein [Spirosomataceae bacterium TFI 002]|nr:PAS domain S-box-containing protein [Spirosomataceae bacterium TFI 002]